jgi:carbon storage regulator
MLVLSRQKNESIMIGKSIKVMVTDVRGDKVRLGIIAPETVPVWREEIYLRMQEEKGAAQNE